MTAVMLGEGALASLAGLIAWRWRRRRVRDSLLPPSWPENFSSIAYKPMLRLAESDDAGFLAAQRGAEEARRYRRLQRRMLRQYLRGLRRDFHGLHAFLAGGARYSPLHVEDKLEFAFSVWSVELRLLLSEVTPVPIDLRPLLADVDDLVLKAREAARARRGYRI